MINYRQIEEILSLYRKYGWQLRRILLTENLKTELKDEIEKLFGATEVFQSNLDGAWFSRAASQERETWELRYLGAQPFALLEVFEAEDEEEIREEARREIENQMLEKLAGKR